MSPRSEIDRRYRHGSELGASADDLASDGRSGNLPANEDALVKRVRLREDSGGRRSLTGLEFRRQRSS